MNEKTESLVLEILRAIRADVGVLREDMNEVKSRLSSLERLMAGVFADKADQNERYDRLVRRIERIEKRLELAE